MMPGKVNSEVLAAELEVFVNILSNSQVSSEDKLANGDRAKFVKGLYPSTMADKLTRTS